MAYRKSNNKKHPNFQEIYSFEDIRATTRISLDCPTNKSGYYPIALCGRDQVCAYGNTAKLGRYDLCNTKETIYTLKYYYATQVWNTAIAIASRSIVGNPFLYIIPHWEDRDDSFRKLVNHEKFTKEAVENLWMQMEEIANSGNIKVHEGFELDNISKYFWGGPDHCYEQNEGKFHIRIVIDARNIVEAKSRIKDIWNDIYNKEDKTYNWNEIKKYFREISLTQRELLNSNWMHRHNKVDLMLFDACSRLNLEDVKFAIEKGANVNALDDSGESALQRTVEFYKCSGISFEDNHTVDELREIEINNFEKTKEIVNYLVGLGADINLYGNGGLTPLVCAYYERSVEMIKFLLGLGADPNVNCYLTDGSHSWGYCSTILNVINEDLEEEYDDIEREIERIIKDAGGRLMAWGWNPEEYTFTGRPFICVWPTTTDIFYDNGYHACGDYRSIRIERDGQETQFISLEDIKGLKEWHEEYINEHQSKEGEQYNQFWIDWRNRGMEIAKEVRKILPDDVDFYYLFDTPTVFENKYGYWSWNRDGERILIPKK